MNYIITDKYNQITGIVLIGGKPEPPCNGHVYEIYCGDIPKHIICDLGSYSYDGHIFDKIPPSVQRQYHVDEYRSAKLASMSSMCNSMIIYGIDIGEDHYSLTTEDQINLTRMGLQANDPNDTSKLIYHPDGKPLRIYTKEEMSFLYNKATAWIEYNTIYFNLLKQVIMIAENVDDFINLNYNTKLPPGYQEQLEEFIDISSYDFNIFEIIDSADYTNIIPKIDASNSVKVFEREMKQREEQIKNEIFH